MMKNFTTEQMANLIRKGIYVTEQLRFENNFAKFVPEDDFERNKIDMPIDWLNHYIRSDGVRGMMLPPQYVLFLKDIKDTPEEKQLWQKWSEQYKNAYNQKLGDLEKSLEENKLKQIGRDVFAYYYAKKINTNILDVCFWRALNSESYALNNIEHRTQMLELCSQFLETSEDILTYQHIMSKTYSKHGWSNFMYDLLLNRINKCEDYSLKEIAPVLINTIQSRNTEAIQLEILKAFKKYDFALTQDIVLSLYRNSSKKKIIQCVKNILNDHAHFEDSEIQGMLNYPALKGRDSCFAGNSPGLLGNNFL